LSPKKLKLSYFSRSYAILPPGYAIFFFFPPVTLFSSVTGEKKEENSVTVGEK